MSRAEGMPPDAFARGSHPRDPEAQITEIRALLLALEQWHRQVAQRLASRCTGARHERCREHYLRTDRRVTSLRSEIHALEALV